MDMRKPNSNRPLFLLNFTQKSKAWLGKRYIWRRYSYSNQSIVVAGAFFLVIAIISFFSLAYYFDSRDPNVIAQKEIGSITKKIGKFMELPEGEEPTLATVSDREKIKDQLFFAKAENGDKVLVYPIAKKAILYRPSTGKIIEVANLTSGNRTEPPVESPATEPANDSPNP